MVRRIYSEATRRSSLLRSKSERPRMARGKTGEAVRNQFTGSLVRHVIELGFYAVASDCQKIFFF